MGAWPQSEFHLKSGCRPNHEQKSFYGWHTRKMELTISERKSRYIQGLKQGTKIDNIIVPCLIEGFRDPWLKLTGQLNP